jgi:hypothetical protein
MNIVWWGVLLFSGLILGYCWGIYQYKNPRWDKKELLGLTEAQAIQILGLPDDKFPIHRSLLWIDYNSLKVLKVIIDEQNKVTNVTILKVTPFLDEDVKYCFSAKRLLDISNKCKLIGYTYEDTCESSKEKKEQFYRELHLKEKSQH